MNDVQVRIADWQKDNADLRRIREAVFIAEQAVPPEQEWDTMMQRHSLSGDRRRLSDRHGPIARRWPDRARRGPAGLARA